MEKTLLCLPLAVGFLFFTFTAATLTRRSISNAVSRGAVCLDGSPGAYYLYRNTSSPRWIIHLESGASVCFGEAAAFCSQFASTPEGSSRTWSCVLPEPQAAAVDDVAILVSSDARRNPAFVGVNRVYVRHCSGDLFIGQRTNSTVNGVYFGGHNIVIAVLEDLIRDHGLGSAAQVLFGGASLGAITKLTTLRAMLPTSTRLAGYSDGLGLRGFPTFDYLEPLINASIHSGNVEGLMNLNLSNDPGLLSIANTVRQMDPYIPASCRSQFGNTAFGGIECFDTIAGAQFAVSGDVALFIFASTWETRTLSLLMGLQRFTCASESGRLTAQEAVYVGTFGILTQQAIRSIPQNTMFVTNVYLANCFRSVFLEDDSLCTLVNGMTPYAAVLHFISESLQMRSVFLADPAASDGRSLGCSATCTASQCSWATAPVRTPADTASLCTGSADGILRFSTGQQCQGSPTLTYAASSTGHSVISRYEVVNASARNAICLDGTPAGFYLNRNPSSSNWVIHLQGGSLCRTPGECQAALQSARGSSNGSACSLPGNDNNGGYASLGLPTQDDPSLNPTFHTWNRVYVRYCTQDLWLGRRPQATNPYGVNHVGHYVVEAVLQDLVTFHGLADSDVVLFGGTSAGAVGAQNHIDSFQEFLVQEKTRLGRPPARFYGYSDAGWFRELPGIEEFALNPTTAFENTASSVFLLQISQLLSGVYGAYFDQSCLANRTIERPVFLGQDCLGASNLWPFISVPMFSISTQFEAFDYELRVSSARAACAAETGSITAPERAFLIRAGDLSRARYSIFQQQQNGVFFPTCFSHSHFDFAPEIGITPGCDDINGVSAYGALSQWVLNRVSGSTTPTRLVGDSPVSPLQCASNCRSLQCQFAITPDTTNTTCPNLSAERINAAFLNYVGTPCISPPTTPPPDMGPCPAAGAATTDLARHQAYLDCWSQTFSRYQAVFDRYVATGCSSP